MEVDINSDELDKQIGETLADKLRGDLELIEGVYPEFDNETYLAGECAPVFFGSALNNFGSGTFELFRRDCSESPSCAGRGA